VKNITKAKLYVPKKTSFACFQRFSEPLLCYKNFQTYNFVVCQVFFENVFISKGEVFISKGEVFITKQGGLALNK
jgi:hypothetical protein